MKRSKFNLSYNNLMTGSMGTLYPIGVTEVLPGDTFQHRTSVFLRSMPLLAPVMHSVTIGINHFFVPNRLVWPKLADGDNWEDFITGGNDGNNAATIPTKDAGATPAATHPLLGYMGIPPVANLQINSLAIRAFNMIFNEFFRDQDLVTARAEEDCTLPKVAWNRDRFTTARPWTQRGSAVSVPISGLAPVQGSDGAFDDTTSANNYPQIQNPSDDAWHRMNAATSFAYASTGGGTMKLHADLSGATAGDVNDWRLAFALQRYKEARARYGARYTEYLRYLGVKSSDARLDRPEFLSGSRQTIAYSEVLQTASETTPSGDPQGVVGAMKGHGIAALRGNKYRRFFEEHGHVITTMFVRPKSIYQNMLEKKWKRTDKESYWQKELQQIGQDAIMRKEVYAEIDETTPGAADQGDTIFGYADRYREYKEQPSYVCGQYRSDDAATLDQYHLARDLSSAPTLNAAFIECDPTKRIYPLTTEDVLWCSVNHSLIARRMVAKGSNSRII